MSGTMDKPIVDIGVACNFAQSYQWWVSVMNLVLNESRWGDVTINAIRTVGSALPDHNKNNVIGNFVKRNALTDTNRTEVVKGFLDGRADYIFWLDDDPAPPPDAITRLYKAGREFVSGVYFLPQPPYHPIAYVRNAEGLYHPVVKYPKGALVQVDSVGMGCALIHKSVYQKIKDEHKVFVRTTGSLAAIHKSQIKNPVFTSHKKREKPFVKAGYLSEQVIPQAPDDDRTFPFYQLEYGRTEDHYFCELAENVGIKPWLDTTVVCEHWKMQGVNNVQHEKYELEQEGLE